MGCRQSLGDRETDFFLIDRVFCVFWVLWFAFWFMRGCVYIVLTWEGHSFEKC